MASDADVAARVAKILSGIDPTEELIAQIADAICLEPQSEDLEIRVQVERAPPASPADQTD